MVPASCVPDEIPNFYGRQEECEAILGHVAGSKTTRLVNIWGSPGFGKTSVAITIANRLREKNIAVYFVSLRGMKSKDELVSKLLSIFTDVKQVPHISPSHWLAQCLQQLQNPFVLILDNADDLLESGDTTTKEEVLRLSKDILTQCCHVKLIFTTRESLDYLKHEVPIHLERVGILDKISSAKLVKSLLPNVSENNSASILKECGQVPLAMRLMCGIMREENVPLNELLEELKTSTLVNGTRKDELYAKTTEVLSKAELFLFSVLHDEQLTFNRLYDNAVEEARRKKQCDIERKLLAAKSFGCLGFFFSNEQNPDSPLQHSFIDAADCPPKLLCYGGIYQILCGKLEDGILLIERSVDRLNNDYGEKVFMILAYHVLAVCHRNRQNDEIASYACSIESESGSLSPAFCSLFSRDTLSSRESNVRCLPESVAERDAFLFALTAELLPPLYKSLGDQFEMELSVITSSLRRLQKVILVMFQEGRVLARVLETCCKGLDRLDCDKEAEEGFELIARQLEDVLGVHKDTARNYHSLGEAQKNFKEYEAAHCSFKKALEMRTSILRETKETAHDSSIIKGTIESLISLTQVFENINGTTADVDNFVTACEELERILVKSKDEHFAQACFVRLGRVFHQIGITYYKMCRYEEAVKQFQKAVELRKELLGDHTETALSLKCLSDSQHASGDVTEAAETLQQLVCTYKALGKC